MTLASGQNFTDRNAAKNPLPVIERVFIFLIVLTSSMFVLQIKGKYFSLLLQVLFSAYMLCKKKRIILPKYWLVIFIFAELFLSAVSAFFSGMPDSYKKSAIVLAIMQIPVFITLVYIRELVKENYDVFGVVIRALKAMTLIQIAWLFLQAVCYTVFKFDLNAFVFVKTLHLVENATFIRSYVFYPSGLTWHSAVLAPVLVMGYVLFDHPLIRAAILGAALICGNSTALIGVLIVAVIVFFANLFRMKNRIRRNRLAILAALALLLFAGLFATGLGQKVLDVSASLASRFFGAEKDASTSAHLGYYSDYWKVFSEGDPLKILFGYGYGCSGYPITLMYGRYTTLSSWAVESDVVNILLSRGIVGFLAYYGFLALLFVRGVRKDVRYGVLLFVWFIQGFGYNIQFEYLFFIELLMYLALCQNEDFFRNVKTGRNWLRLKWSGSAS